MVDPAAAGAPRAVVVGVSPGQPPHIVAEAARFARAFDVELVCAYVDPGRYPTAEDADGQVESAPIDPDLPDDPFGPRGGGEVDLDAELAEVLDALPVTWSTRRLAGDVTVALGHLADTLDASMIVVGTHERSFTGGLQEFFNRSVAVHLAHRQQRPVVVVPARAPGSLAVETASGA